MEKNESLIKVTKRQVTYLTQMLPDSIYKKLCLHDSKSYENGDMLPREWFLSLGQEMMDFYSSKTKNFNKFEIAYIIYEAPRGKNGRKAETKPKTIKKNKEINLNGLEVKQKINLNGLEIEKNKEINLDGLEMEEEITV